MNVLRWPKRVPYDEVHEPEDIGSSFTEADVGFRHQTNDVTSPDAETNTASPIYGMPVLKVWNAKTVFFIKRSLASGYAGVENPLFFRDNTMMLLGDAKKMTEEIVKGLWLSGIPVRGQTWAVRSVPRDIPRRACERTCGRCRCPGLPVAAYFHFHQNWTDAEAIQPRALAASSAEQSWR